VRCRGKPEKVAFATLTSLQFRKGRTRQSTHTMWPGVIPRMARPIIIVWIFKAEFVLDRAMDVSGLDTSSR